MVRLLVVLMVVVVVVVVVVQKANLAQPLSSLRLRDCSPSVYITSF
jgi:hypothetical protein